MPRGDVNRTKITKSRKSVSEIADDKDLEIKKLKKDLARLKREKDQSHDINKLFECENQLSQAKATIAILKSDLQKAVHEKEETNTKCTTVSYDFLQKDLKLHDGSCCAAVLDKEREFYNYKLSYFANQLWEAKWTTTTLEADLQRAISENNMLRVQLTTAQTDGTMISNILNELSNAKWSVNILKERIKFLESKIGKDNEVENLEKQKTDLTLDVEESTTVEQPSKHHDVSSSSVENFGDNVFIPLSNLFGRIEKVPGGQLVAEPYGEKTCIFEREPKQEIPDDAEREWTSEIKQIMEPAIINDDCPPEKRVKMEIFLASMDEFGVKQEEINY